MQCPPRPNIFSPFGTVPTNLWSYYQWGLLGLFMLMWDMSARNLCKDHPLSSSSGEYEWRWGKAVHEPAWWGGRRRWIGDLTWRASGCESWWKRKRISRRDLKDHDKVRNATWGINSLCGRLLKAERIHEIVFRKQSLRQGHIRKWCLRVSKRPAASQAITDESSATTLIN